MPGTAVTKSVIANEPGGRKREEIFVDVIEKISVTFSSSVSALDNSCSNPMLQFLIFKYVWTTWIYNLIEYLFYHCKRIQGGSVFSLTVCIKVVIVICIIFFIWIS